jgi:hypothetical protein
MKKSFLIAATVVAAALFLFSGCELDAPPNPAPPYTPPDGAYNITQLADSLAENPDGFDTGDFIRMKGSWQDFWSAKGEVSGYADPLGKLYAALKPLDQSGSGGKTIKLDFSLVSGRNIVDSNPVLVASRPKHSIAALKFPADMQSIGDYSFEDCTSLAKLIFSGDTPPEIGDNSFSGVRKDIEITVPEGRDEAYAPLLAKIKG